MATVDYPSDTLRGVPRFRFAVPDGWTVTEHPRALAVVYGPDAGGFRTNALISTARVAADTDLGALAAASVRRAATAGTDATIEDQRAGAFGDRETFFHALTFMAGTPPQRIAQVHACFGGPTAAGRDLRDVFTVVGSCLADEVEQIAPVFVGIAATFQFLDV